MLTSERPQINNAQYPWIPSKVLQGASNKEVIEDVVAEDCNVHVWSTMKPKIC
jgi:hypothetical protein